MLSVFPQLAKAEFEEACIRLLHCYQDREHEQNDWTSVELVQEHELSCLRISKELTATTAVSPSVEAGNEVDDVQEDDNEVLESMLSPAIVVYDIFLSPVYRVPVLYFHISDSQHRYPITMTTLYNHLIPQQYKAQAERVGVIGGITICDHPVTSRPAFFIHPCQTAQVMEASLTDEHVTTYNYLLAWIGALGPCVGLNVPLALGQIMAKQG
ncbi:hypothetical protein ACN47E_005012 [Coniothyrium glycines]